MPYLGSWSEFAPLRQFDPGCIFPKAWHTHWACGCPERNGHKKLFFNQRVFHWPPSRRNWTPMDSNCFSRGGERCVPVFLRNNIVTCDFPSEGGSDTLSPLWVRPCLIFLKLFRSLPESERAPVTDKVKYWWNIKNISKLSESIGYKYIFKKILCRPNQQTTLQFVCRFKRRASFQYLGPFVGFWHTVLTACVSSEVSDDSV